VHGSICGSPAHSPHPNSRLELLPCGHEPPRVIVPLGEVRGVTRAMLLVLVPVAVVPEVTVALEPSGKVIVGGEVKGCTWVAAAIATKDLAADMVVVTGRAYAAEEVRPYAGLSAACAGLVICIASGAAMRAGFGSAWETQRMSGWE
jgi:hypothetical protein